MSGGFLYVDDSFLRIALEPLAPDLDFFVTVRIPLKLEMPYHCGGHHLVQADLVSEVVPSEIVEAQFVHSLDRNDRRATRSFIANKMNRNTICLGNTQTDLGASSTGDREADGSNARE